MEGFNANKVKMSDFDVMQTLGTGNHPSPLIPGSFGRVHLARNKKGGNKGNFVAVKMLKKAEILRLK